MHRIVYEALQVCTSAAASTESVGLEEEGLARDIARFRRLADFEARKQRARAKPESAPILVLYPRRR